MKKLLLIAAVLAGGVAASQAGVSVSVGFGFPYPEQVYVGYPAPYCAPPMYYAPPCAPRVIVYPGYRYSYGHGYYGNWRGNDRWQGRGDRWQGHDRWNGRDGGRGHRH